MKVFRGLPQDSNRQPCALTIGNFDGVHRGHQALLAQVREAADRLGVQAAVMTFDPHPKEFFAQRFNAPDKAPRRIANLRDKLNAFAYAKMDRVVVEHFNTHFAGLTPDAFIENILVKGLQVRWIIIGEDFYFGANRAGNIDTLREAGKKYGFEVHTIPTVMQNNDRISSSAVRHALEQSNFELANQLLGYPYMISGHVIHGQKLGRTIGFPTLNILIRHRRPAVTGIFVVRVHGLGAQPIDGVASLGVRPTVTDHGQVLLETYLLNYHGNCYGKLLHVEFLKKLRDEEKFDDLPTLIKAIEQDVDNARAYFQEHKHAATSVTDRIRCQTAI